MPIRRNLIKKINKKKILKTMPCFGERESLLSRIYNLQTGVAVLRPRVMQARSSSKAWLLAPARGILWSCLNREKSRLEVSLVSLS